MNNKTSFSALLELIITSILVGLIWTIQIVHYPLFLIVGKNEYTNYQQHHVDAIGPLVAPLMILELFIFFYHFYSKQYDSNKTAILIGFLLVIIWTTTAFISVPIHNQLLIHKNSQLIIKLVSTNWIRTASWTLKLIILSLIFYHNQKKSRCS